MIFLRKKQIFESYSILWDIFLKQSSNFESFFFEGSKKVQFYESYLEKKKFNSLSHVEKKGLILWVIFFKKSILWVLFKKGFNSLSHIEKEGSILWVIFTKGFNSLSQIQKRFHSFSHIFEKRVQFLKVIFLKKRRLKSLSHVQKKVQFFESCKKKVHFFE